MTSDDIRQFFEQQSRKRRRVDAGEFYCTWSPLTSPPSADLSSLIKWNLLCVSCFNFSIKSVWHVEPTSLFLSIVSFLNNLIKQSEHGNIWSYFMISQLISQSILPTNPLMNQLIEWLKTEKQLRDNKYLRNKVSVKEKKS